MGTAGDPLGGLSNFHPSCLSVTSEQLREGQPFIPEHGLCQVPSTVKVAWADRARVGEKPWRRRGTFAEDQP